MRYMKRDVYPTADLSKPTKAKRVHCSGGMGGYKVSDEEVRDIRIRYWRNKQTVEEIHQKYNQLALSYITRIVYYQSRLSATCEI
jgi:hypothetical protein